MAANAMAAALSLAFVGLIKGASDLGNALVGGIAYPIQEILKLAAPFSDIAKDALVGVNELVDGIKLKVPDAIMDFAAAQVEATAIARTAFDKLALHQLPSESIDQWVARVKEGVEKAAEETRLAVADSLVKKDEESTGTEPAENVEALRLQEETQGIIEALADRYRLEEETTVEYYARINEAIRIGEDAGTITKQQAANARK
ncbi:MAG: hypothetical protein GY814_00400, partial [Gammaproteobacteria bacterium]|nr:hypothetical protein [Gammaproteobacteria bacterium]